MDCSAHRLLLLNGAWNFITPMLRPLYLWEKRLSTHCIGKYVGIEAFTAVSLLMKMVIHDSVEKLTRAAASIQLLCTQSLCLLRYFGSNDNLLLYYRLRDITKLS
jgi:hypothetical protein